ncbi:MAG: DEAD/DEAH box helicase [Parachlamydiaceae bacterium]|nr:DEAD/DEAH box helicase [Parachlamydiaceae bacterium]
MVKLPSKLKIYQEDANRAIAKGLVKDIEFSGATYQILVIDSKTKKDCWVFLQLEGKGQIKDVFCSCEETNEWEETTPCKHMAAAYLSIFDSHSLPLHQRFIRSLWNQICQIYEERVGDDPSTLTTIDVGSYVYRSATGKDLFTIKGRTPTGIQQVENLLHNKNKETEETSLKFSNLSQDEITKWKEGRPSPQLSYQLSYWCDLAKWLMRLQEDGTKYEIEFTYSKKDVPNWMQINFTDVEIKFYIPESKLPLIIPSLATVKSPLIIQYADHQDIACISYVPEEGRLYVEAEKQTTYKKGKIKFDHSQERAISIDGWTYIPKQGFFAEEPHILLQSPYLEGEDLSDALSEYGRMIAKFLTDCEVHLDPILPSYKLWLDSEWDLHIHYYLFEPNDLSKGHSALLGDWVYLDDDGFYHLKEKRFETIETVIPAYQISDFVTQHRAWLNNQENFQVHIRSLEYQLSYNVSNTSRLTFTRTIAKVKEDAKPQDFGAWVYLEDYGFYPKSMSSYGLLVKPGLSLSAEQVPLFIKMNRDELSLIPGFFSAVCPIIKMGLKVELTPQNTIKVQPKYDVVQGHRDKPLKLYDDFVFVEGEGFHELPIELRLPEKFRHAVELEGGERDVFLLTELDEIRKYIIELDPRLAKPKERSLQAGLIEHVKEKGRGWYKFTFFYKTEKGLIPVIDIWEGIKKKQSFIIFGAGLIALQDKRYDWVRHLKKDRVDKAEGSLLLTALEFMRLNAFDSIDLLESVPFESPTRELLDELTQLRTPEEPDMGGLLSHLRPYQEIGVRWLWFLYHQQLSGLLCDDMGLGKTHQAMALLSSIRNLYHSYAEGVQRHFLVVCPTSVIYHWQEKLEQFLPSLKVHTFYGADRTLDSFQENYDVLLTSYGILRNEQAVLSKIPFEVAIFDEIQIAKNQSSRVYSALTKINAQMKLGLTGTPIENYLRELKSLFDIVLPSYMPGESEYREFFTRPIEKDHNHHRKDVLNRLIKPFILRRKKEDVLTDLPEKIEEISHCDLLAYQRQLYADVLQQRRRHLFSEMEENSGNIPYMHIFALLSSLKQICDHPAVYLKKPQDYKQYTSGKWELFLELLNEARESNQKVVVFSQYLGMLDIIQSHLEENNIGYAAIRGATQNRKEEIQRFNRDPSCEVFVGSLQAAGLGVDLTAGSVVIHYDRWWNAARENQATDRVHRIGQTRGVQVFKLITKNTFEEKIDLMIRRKGQLMEDVIGIDDHKVLKKFSREELMDLLNFSEAEETHQSIADIEMGLE